MRCRRCSAVCFHRENVKAKPTVDLDIFNGQGATRAVQEIHEEDIGAFTVANRNDTNGDGTPDNDPSQSPVNGEKDLMKLIIWRPKPNNGGNVTLQFDSGAQAVGSMVKLWTDDKKTTEIPLTNGALTIPINTINTPFGGGFRKEVWVELCYGSVNVRDVTATLTYNGFTDKVAATAIWAVQTDFKNRLTDTMWSDAGKPLTDTFTGTYGGKFGIQYAPDPVNVQYAMGMEFRIGPSAKVQEWDKWHVKFDVTRQKERGAWKIVGNTVTSLGTVHWPGRTSFSSAAPTGASIDYSNDDDPNPPGGIPNSDNDNTPQNDHVYSIDGPGFPNNGAVDQVIYRANFLEFVRVRFDGHTPDRTQGNEGSRCSGKWPWYVTIWAEKHGTSYQQRAGKPNAVAEGYSAILPAPSP